MWQTGCIEKKCVLEKKKVLNPTWETKLFSWKYELSYDTLYKNMHIKLMSYVSSFLLAREEEDAYLGHRSEYISQKEVRKWYCLHPHQKETMHDIRQIISWNPSIKISMTYFILDINFRNLCKHDWHDDSNFECEWLIL